MDLRSECAPFRAWPRGVVLSVVVAVLLTVATAAADGPKPHDDPKVSAPAALTKSPAPDRTAAGEERLREGTEWKERQGVFRQAGDRVAFYPSGANQRFVVLENLALDRVVRAIEASPVPLRWSVSGVITEFRGTNYLVLRRATVLGPAAGHTP